MEPAIAVQELTKQFDGFTAVDGVTFTVSPGEIVGYLGPNGSGKTTTIRMLLGLLQPTGGEGQVLGLDIRTQAEAIRPRVGYMSQRFALYNELTAAENLHFYAGVYGVADRVGRVREVLQMVGLAGHGKARAGELSAGWRQRLALAAALTHRPSLIFLDEPTSGVDPKARRAFWDLMYTLADAGTTLFVTTHYMDEAEYCDRLGIMFRGRLLALDTPGALKSATAAGATWQVETAAPLADVMALAGASGVQRVNLSGNSLRVVTATGAHTAESLRALLSGLGLTVTAVTPSEATLDDVFITLAGR